MRFFSAFGSPSNGLHAASSKGLHAVCLSNAITPMTLITFRNCPFLIEVHRIERCHHTNQRSRWRRSSDLRSLRSYRDLLYVRLHRQSCEQEYNISFFPACIPSHPIPVRGGFVKPNLVPYDYRTNFCTCSLTLTEKIDIGEYAKVDIPAFVAKDILDRIDHDLVWKFYRKCFKGVIMDE